MSRQQLVSRRRFLCSAAMAFPALAASPAADSLDGKPGYMESRGFTTLPHVYNGRVHTVYRKGSGPAVVVLHELPGLTRQDVDLASRLAKRDFSVYVPLLFGAPGDDHLVTNLFLRCLPGSGFTCICHWRTSAAVRWVADFVDKNEDFRSAGVGLIGMCLTGGMPLAMLPIEHVKAAILCQPTQPFLSASLDISHTELSNAVSALDRKKLAILVVRFDQDRLSSPGKLKTLWDCLHGHVAELVLEGDAHGKRHPHSTLAEDFDETEGTPQCGAFERVVRYLDHRLGRPRGDPFPEVNDCATVPNLECRVSVS